MIELRNITKSFWSLRGRHFVFRDVNLTIPTGRNVGILGHNGAGKSTLLNLLGGIDRPDSGQIVHHGSISWPLGKRAGLHPNLSGYDNIRFICQIYGRAKEYPQVRDFVEDFAEIGRYMSEPFRIYSPGMASRVAFGLSLAFQFDVLLIDEMLSAGDPSFREKAQLAFRELVGKSTVVLVSHNMQTQRQISDMGVVLQRGQPPRLFDKIDDAIHYHLGHSSGTDH